MLTGRQVSNKRNRSIGVIRSRSKNGFWPVTLQIMSLCLLNIRIYHKCEGGIEKSVSRITIWHHEAWQVMTNADCEGRIFLSHPHTNNGLCLFVCLILHVQFNNLSVSLGRVFLGWTSNKLGLICLAYLLTSKSTIFLFRRDGSSWVEPVLS